MPLQIHNQALYADRTVQDWHRRVMPRNADAIDLDLMGVCPHSWCRKSLYGIEATTNPSKPSSSLLRLARDAGMAGIIVFHDSETITGFKVIYDPHDLKVSEDSSRDPGEALEAYLMLCRAYHEAIVHRG